MREARWEEQREAQEARGSLEVSIQGRLLRVSREARESTACKLDLEVVIPNRLHKVGGLGRSGLICSAEKTVCT